MALLAARLAGWAVDRSALIGSSLGGFYAVLLAEHLGCRAVLLDGGDHALSDFDAHLATVTGFLGLTK